MFGGVLVFNLGADIFLFSSPRSRKNTDPTQSPPALGPETALAAVWRAVVCRMHDVDCG